MNILEIVCSAERIFMHNVCVGGGGRGGGGGGWGEWELEGRGRRSIILVDIQTGAIAQSAAS